MTPCAFTRGESNSGRESDFGTTPVSCLGGCLGGWAGEGEAAAASAIPDTERPEKRRSVCCKAFVQNCRKSAGVEPSHREKCADAPG